MSFSQTRQSPSRGWERVLGACGNVNSVFDLACGNLRFERYAHGVAEASQAIFHCVDCCDALASLGHDEEALIASYQHLDIIEAALGSEGSLDSALEAPECDLAVCFGFMHHVPGAATRKRVLSALANRTKEGGVAALSFWRFMDDAGLARRALSTTAEAMRAIDVELDEGDYFVGWDGRDGVFRYCHSFTDEELDELVDSAAPQMELIGRFKADGRTGALNSYLVFRRMR